MEDVATLNFLDIQIYRANIDFNHAVFVQNYRGDLMFTRKHIILGLVLSFLTVIIGWTTWYFVIVRPKLIAEPIIRYNTKSQITTDDKVNTAAGEKSQIRKIGTAGTHKSPKVRSQSVREGNKNTTASSTQKEPDKYIDHPHKSNDKELTAEELAKRKAKRKAEIEEEVKNIKNQLNELNFSFDVIEKQAVRLKASSNKDEIRSKLVERLNSLSAEDQEAYFEDIKSGKAIDNYLETFRTGLTEKGIPDSFIQVYLEYLRPQLSQDLDAEKYLKELREHGFEPKF